MGEENIKKRILILGGIPHMIDVVETAKRMGIETIVTDSSPNSLAKNIADKAYDISTTDIKSLVEMCKKERVNGVFSAFEDLNTWNAQALCEELGLPFYASKQQLEITSNKDLFKEECRKYNIPVIEEYLVDNFNDFSNFKKNDFPLIVKPVDSYGSKGITICYSLEELKAAYLKAQSFSKSNKVILERFVESNHGVEFYYTVQDSKITLTAVADRYIYKQSKNLPPLPVATVIPSKYTKLYIEKLDYKVKEMLKGMKLENGVILIQSLFENKSFYVYEMAYRLSGEKHYQIIEKQTGVNLLEMMINLAIEEKYQTLSSVDTNSYSPSCNLSYLLGEGEIKEIKGLEMLQTIPSVISYLCTQNVGDKIEATGSYSQMFMRINIIAKNSLDLKEIINQINSELKVISKDGRDMIIGKFLNEGDFSI